MYIQYVSYWLRENVISIACFVYYESFYMVFVVQIFQKTQVCRHCRIPFLFEFEFRSEDIASKIVKNEISKKIFATTPSYS